MSAPSPHLITQREVLRVALDKEATQSFALMAERLKTENTHVKVMPSQFVSFLVTEFYKTYFEKDLSILIAEFFDSRGYYEAFISRSKSNKDFALSAKNALEKIQEIKTKARRRSPRKSKKVELKNQS
jgi:hypothetical protein